MMQTRPPRTSVGLALLASSAVILVVAALVGARVLPVDDEVRVTIVTALAAVAGLDLVVGLWFLRRGR
jgi:hypothetical protein